MENRLAASQKAKQGVTMWPHNFTSGYSLKRINDKYSNKYMNMNNKKVEAAQMSIHERLDKEIVV